MSPPSSVVSTHHSPSGGLTGLRTSLGAGAPTTRLPAMTQTSMIAAPTAPRSMPGRAGGGKPSAGGGAAVAHRPREVAYPAHDGPEDGRQEAADEGQFPRH